MKLGLHHGGSVYNEIKPSSLHWIIAMKKPHLTPRQREVVRLSSLGCTNDEIARILGISESTVDNHRDRAMFAMGTNKAPLLARLAIKHRITTLNDRLSNAEKRKSGRKKDGWN